MSDQMASQMVTDALLVANWRRGRPKDVLHHSAQNSQLTCEPFHRRMADHVITCSMNRPGNVWNNAAKESFCSSRKTEQVRQKSYRTRKQARADAFARIERFHNPKRRHAAIGFLSPIPFRERTLQAQMPVYETGTRCNPFGRLNGDGRRAEIDTGHDQIEPNQFLPRGTPVPSF